MRKPWYNSLVRIFRNLDSLAIILVISAVGGVLLYGMYIKGKLGESIAQGMEQPTPPLWYYLFTPMLVAWVYNKMRQIRETKPQGEIPEVQAPKPDEHVRNKWNLDYVNHPTTGLYGARPVNLTEIQGSLSDWRGGRVANWTVDVSLDKISKGHYGTSGKVRIPAGTVYLYGGKPVSVIDGDPRALAVLGFLTEGLKLRFMGILNPGSKLNHNPKYGCAIDIPDDDIMNEILSRAMQHDIPIAWISKNRADNGRWPIFQVVGGKKVLRGYSSQNHDSHFHVDLPRPNWAQLYMCSARFK